MEPQSWRTCITTIWLDLAMRPFKMLDLFTFPSCRPKLGIISLISTCPVGEKQYLIVLNCISLITNAVEHPYLLFVFLFLWIACSHLCPTFWLLVFFLIALLILLVKVLILCVAMWGAFVFVHLLPSVSWPFFFPFFFNWPLNLAYGAFLPIEKFLFFV